MNNFKNIPWSLEQNKEIQKTIDKYKNNKLKIIKKLKKKKIIFQNDSVLARFGYTLDKEFSWLKKINIKRSPLIFDIGCNIGINSLSYNILFKNSKLYSFEPVKDTFSIFKKNISNNKLKNIKIYNLGFSDRKCQSFLSIPSQSQGERYKHYVNHALYSIYGKGKKKVKVNLDTVDNFVNKKLIKKIDFIKIDVEGHELNVLEGAKQTIKKFKPVIQLEYNYISKILTKTSLDDYLNFAKKFKYKILLLGKGYKLIKPNIKKIYKYSFSDMIFIP